MSGVSLLFYNTVSEDTLLSCGYVSDSDYEFRFEGDGKAISLETSGGSSRSFGGPTRLFLSSVDPDLQWIPERDTLAIHKTVVIEFPTALYGQNGLMPMTSGELGICIIWSCKGTDLSGVCHPSRISTRSLATQYDFDIVFSPGTVAKQLVLRVTPYVKKAASYVRDNEKALANTVGMKLGEFETVTLLFKDEFQQFPIVEEDNPLKPLWWIDIGAWDDPTTDPFDSTAFVVHLNKRFQDCPSGGLSVKNPALLAEILASSYSLLFLRLKEDDEWYNAALSGEGCEEDSICAYLHYFRESCSNPKLDFSLPERLHETLFANLLRMLKVVR